jgi:hypothetical protein
MTYKRVYRDFLGYWQLKCRALLLWAYFGCIRVILGDYQ